MMLDAVISQLMAKMFSFEGAILVYQGDIYSYNVKKQVQ